MATTEGDAAADKAKQREENLYARLLNDLSRFVSRGGTPADTSFANLSGLLLGVLLTCGGTALLVLLAVFIPAADHHRAEYTRACLARTRHLLCFPDGGVVTANKHGGDVEFRVDCAFSCRIDENISVRATHRWDVFESIDDANAAASMCHDTIWPEWREVRENEVLKRGFNCYDAAENHGTEWKVILVGVMGGLVVTGGCMVMVHFVRSLSRFQLDFAEDLTLFLEMTRERTGIPDDDAAPAAAPASPPPGISQA